MEPEALFIQTLEDLHRSISSSDEYDVLRASHLIRQLLLDGANSLVERVNRTHRLKIEYFVSQVSPPVIPGLPTPEIWCAVDGIAPSMGPPGSQPIHLRWDKFQKVVVAMTCGHAHSVHDVIDYLAHIAGGVHVGSPRTDKDRVLASLQGRLPGMQLSLISSTLRAIGRVILSGLSDLKDRVLGVNRFEGGPGISIYLTFVLAPMPGGQENYILDLGSTPNCNRVTIFVDAHGELCVRIFSAVGRMLTLRVGSVGGAYRYGEPQYLCVEIGQQIDSVLVYVDSTRWELARVFNVADGPILSCPIPVVLGSDLNGRSQCNMLVMEQVMFSNVPSNQNRRNMRKWLSRQISEGTEYGIAYEPGAFHHSREHPNFPPIGKERNLLGSDAVICWRGKAGGDLVSSMGPPPRMRKLK